MRGIDQGSPYSPLALNVLLHRHHDLGFSQADPPWFRYVDNLTYPCHSVAEGQQILARAGHSLHDIGLRLKGQDGVVDLGRGEQAQLLGFKLFRVGSQLRFGLGEQAWLKLEQSLQEAHKSPNPAQMATAVIRGWIGGYGPALENCVEETLHRVSQLASHHGFREVNLQEAKEWCRTSWERWEAYRNEGQPSPPMPVLPGADGSAGQRQSGRPLYDVRGPGAPCNGALGLIFSNVEDQFFESPGGRTMKEQHEQADETSASQPVPTQCAAEPMSQVEEPRGPATVPLDEIIIDKEFAALIPPASEELEQLRKPDGNDDLPRSAGALAGAPDSAGRAPASRSVPRA